MNTQVPRTIRMQASDNVAIVVNDGGLPAGTVFPDGLTLLEGVPQGHKVSLVDLVVVVDVPEHVQVERAVARGLSEQDVHARMSRQASRERRLDAADHVIDNAGTVAQTRNQVDALWAQWSRR